MKYLTGYGNISRGLKGEIPFPFKVYVSYSKTSVFYTVNINSFFQKKSGYSQIKYVKNYGLDKNISIFIKSIILKLYITDYIKLQIKYLNFA